MTTLPTRIITDPELQQHAVKAENFLADSITTAINSLVDLAVGLRQEKESSRGSSSYFAPPDRHACIYLLDFFLGPQNVNTKLTTTQPGDKQAAKPHPTETLTLTQEELLTLCNQQEGKREGGKEAKRTPEHPNTSNQQPATNNQPPALRVPNFEEPFDLAHRIIANNLRDIVLGLYNLAKGITIEKEPGDACNVYTRPPDRRACQYLINRFLGNPGTLIILPEPPTAETPIAPPAVPGSQTGAGDQPQTSNQQPATSFGALITFAEGKIASYVGVLIKSLTDLAEGVLVQRKSSYGSNLDLRAPDRRACQYLCNRVFQMPRIVQPATEL